MDLIWRSQKKVKFADFCHSAPIVPNFLGAKIFMNKVIMIKQIIFTEKSKII